MAKIAFSDITTDPPGKTIEIDLKNPWLAGILGLVLPGMGHLYQGRTGKGLLFLVCVLGTFLYGLYLGGSHVVYASVPGQPPFRWQFICQAGIGLPAAPALVKRNQAIASLRDGRVQWPEGFMAPPKQEPSRLVDASGNESVQPNELAMWNISNNPLYEVGTVYTMIAGLLNVLVVCDAIGGPLVVLPKPKKKKSREEGKADAESKTVQESSQANE